MTDGPTTFSPTAYVKILRDEIAAIEAMVLALPSPFTGVKGTGRAAMFRETTIVQLALARGWLGKALGTLGEPTPYPASDDPGSPVIHPPAYAKPSSMERDNIAQADVVAGIKQIRSSITKALDHIGQSWPFDPHPPGFDRYTALSRTSLEAARMMLGEELGIIGGY